MPYYKAPKKSKVQEADELIVADAYPSPPTAYGDAEGYQPYPPAYDMSNTDYCCYDEEAQTGSTTCCSFGCCGWSVACTCGSNPTVMIVVVVILLLPLTALIDSLFAALGVTLNLQGVVMLPLTIVGTLLGSLGTSLQTIAADVSSLISGLIGGITITI